MIRTILTGVLSVAALMWTVGCAATSTQTMTLADGTTATFTLKGDKPQFEGNDWVEVKNVDLPLDFQSNPSGQAFWVFALKPKRSDIVAVEVAEMLHGDVWVVGTDRSAQSDPDGTWRARTTARPLDSAELAWSTQPGPTMFVFRFRMLNDKGQANTVYQLVSYSGRAKQALQWLRVQNQRMPDISPRFAGYMQ